MRSKADTHWIKAFLSDPENQYSWIFWVWAGLLWAAGLAVWGFFLNWGLGPYNFHDWFEITVPRLTFLQNAVRQGLLPVHIADPAALNKLTDRFLGIPDVLLSPQIMLLQWLEVRQFILVNVLLLYSVGYTGLLVFARRYRLSALAFTVLALLFNLNGHLVAHFSVGHLSWTGFFLFSWVLLLLFDLFEGRTGWMWVLCFAGVLLAMLLQGGYHPLVYSLFLLGLMVLVRPAQWRWIAAAGLAAILLCAARLLPATLNLAQIDENIKFIGGYLDISEIFSAMLVQQTPNELTMRLGAQNTLGTWELSLYIGLLGIAFLAVFGVVLPIIHRQRANQYSGLLIAVVPLALLSLDQVFKWLGWLVPLPPISGERVAARFLSLAFLVVLFVAVIEFQSWLNQQKPSPGLWVGLSGFTLALGHDLLQNLRYWQVRVAAGSFNSFIEQPDRWTVANHPDPSYFNIVKIGAGVSLLTLVVLLVLCYREVRQRHPLYA